MTQPIPMKRRARPRHRPYRRWSADEKAAYLAAFRRSGRSAVAFCREQGVRLATFSLWKRDARRAREAGPSFARVAVVPTTPPPPADAPRAGLRMIVRGPAGHEAALDGVDGATAVRLVALVLGRRR